MPHQVSLWRCVVPAPLRSSLRNPRLVLAGRHCATDPQTVRSRPASLENLLQRLNNDEFDLVAVGRALLVDPDWAQKVREGREQDILPFSREALMTLV